MAATLPLSGNGNITMNNQTPGNGQYKLADAGAHKGYGLYIEGSNASDTDGDKNGGDVLLTGGVASGSGLHGVVKIAGTSGKEIQFHHHGDTTHPKIVFVGNSVVINWPYDKNLYFGENSYTGYFLVRGCKVGIATTSPSERLDVNGNVKVSGGGWNSGHIRLGNYHLWLTATYGILMIKNGAPTWDGDGTAVASQS